MMFQVTRGGLASTADKCGKEVTPEAQFCAGCGAPLGKAALAPAAASGISPKVWIAVGSVAGVVLLGMAGILGLGKWYEMRANRLFTDAIELVQEGQQAEKSSYTEAFQRYKMALDNGQTIIRDYPSTSPAIRLMQDETLGSYTVKELQETVVPTMQKKADMEGDPLAVALLVLKKCSKG